MGSSRAAYPFLPLPFWANWHMGTWGNVGKVNCGKTSALHPRVMCILSPTGSRGELQSVPRLYLYSYIRSSSPTHRMLIIFGTRVRPKSNLQVLMLHLLSFAQTRDGADLYILWLFRSCACDMQKKKHDPWRIYSVVALEGCEGAHHYCGKMIFFSHSVAETGQWSLQGVY